MCIRDRYYYDDVRPAREAAHELSRAETRAGPCTTCTKKSRKALIFLAVAMMYFPEPNAYNSAYYVVQRIVRNSINVVLPDSTM